MIRSGTRSMNILAQRVLKFHLGFIGLLLIGWAANGTTFRDFENYVTAVACLPIAIGVALIALSFTLGSRWQTSALWFSNALVYQSISLQLINAGWQLRYQHFKPINEIVGDEYFLILLIILLLQVVLLGIAAHHRFFVVLTWLREKFRAYQLFFLVVVVVMSTTTLSRDVSAYLAEWAFALLIQSFAFANIIMILSAIPQETLTGLDRIVAKLIGDRRLDDRIKTGGADWLTIALALFVLITTSLLCIYSYDRHPHVTDEVAYLFHARIFAEGSIAIAPPPVNGAFDLYLLTVKDGYWFPVPPPGWPAILAIGVLLGIEWLVNPMLAGVNIVLAYILIREFYPRAVARISIALLATSPWYLFLGMSYMTHMVSLSLALSASIGLAWSRRTSRSYWALLSGVSLGALSLVRPLEAVAVAGVLGCWLIGLGGKRSSASTILVFCIGTLMAGGIGLYYNFHFTGDPFSFPISEYTDAQFGKNSNAYGFGADRGIGWELDPYPGHGPIDAIVNTNLNVSATNTELFGWSIGSLLFAAIGIVFGNFRPREYFLLLTIAVIYVLHFFYYFSGGPDFGARYWFLMILPLIVLSTRGILLLSQLVDQSRPGRGVGVLAIVACLVIISMVTFVPWRAIDKYPKFRGMRPDIRYLAEQHGFGRSLVLIQGNSDPDYSSAAVYNPLDFGSNEPIYAWDRDVETRRELIAAFGDRKIWLVKGPSLTKKGFEVAAGPLEPSEVR